MSDGPDSILGGQHASKGARRTIETENETMRTRHVETETDREAVVDELIREGYEVQSETETETELRYMSLGKTWVHILLFLTTIGVGNVIYALWYGRRSKDEVRVVLE